MNDDPSKPKGPSSNIPTKLAVLLGSGLAILNGSPAADTANPEVHSPTAKTQLLATTSTRPLPSKLTIKQFKTGFKMIAQHDSHTSHSSHSSHSSHDSHSSHSSHNSHSSHDSHASHSSHDSHSSHTSHTSGGFA
jgi:hypothetical protein